MRCQSQHNKTKLGSGYILSEAAKDLRRHVNRVDGTFERAFYSGYGSGGGSYGGSGYNNYGGGGYNYGGGY